MKKLVKILSALEIILVLIMYFIIDYHFDNDKSIMKILPKTDFKATVLRLSIYIIPGINLISGIFGVTFNTRGLLSFVGLLEIFAGWLTLYYKGRSQLMNIMGIIIMVIGILYVISVQIAYRKKESKISD